MINLHALIEAQMAAIQVKQATYKAQMNLERIARKYADNAANEELELRTNNPAVKHAWEQYQIALKLCKV